MHTHGTMTWIYVPPVFTWVIEDSGPGIEDIDKAMQEGFSTGDG